jgi:signal transduction histidine kinase/ligand-binding sensor domain-containing protein/DNA-binding response OmpR family regulator
MAKLFYRLIAVFFVRGLFLIFGIIVYLDAAAQQELKFTHITNDDGLSQSTVLSILKDKYGFMWFATYDGLNRYDGYRFKVYRNIPKKPHSLSSNSVSTLFEDKQGTLWVGTNDGLSRYDKASDSFTNYHTSSDKGSLSSNSVTSINEDYLGNLWIGTYQGLNILNRKTNQFKRYNANVSNPDSLSNNSISSLFEDTRHNFWIGTNMGLNIYDRKKNQFVKILNKNQGAISENYIKCIVEDDLGNLWIGTNGAGLNRYDYKTRNLIAFKYDAKNRKSISSNAVYALAKAGDGSLWVGTENGINRLNVRTNEFSSSKNDPNDVNSLLGNSVRAILQDTQGILWVSTYSGGINKSDKNLPLFDVYRGKGIHSQGLSFRVTASFEESRNGNIWIGTDGGGLNLLNPKTGVFKHFMHDSTNVNSLSINSVLTMLRDKHSDNIWLGTYAGGLDYFDPVKNTFKHYKKGNGANQLSDDHIYALMEDHKGNIWIGTNERGVNVLDPVTEKVTQYTANPSNQDDKYSIATNVIRALFEDKSGDIWIGTYNSGINIFHPATKTFSRLTKANSNLSNDIVYCIKADSQGNTWVGTTDGLNLWDPQHNKFVSYNIESGLSSNVINSIVEDAQGIIWLSTNNGISRFDPKHHIFKNYNLDNGLQSREFFLHAGFITSTGKLYFGGIQGFNVIDPTNIIENHNVPHVVLTDFQLFNKSVTVGAKNSPLTQSIIDTKEITLTHDQTVLTFGFAALDYTLPGKNQYAYRLEGFDKNWIYAGTQHTATYTNLDAGTYFFRVKASNSDGIWNEKGTIVKIIILPPYWATWWFRLLLLGFVASVIYMVFKTRVHNIQKQKRALEKQVFERTSEVKKQAEDLQKLNEELQVQTAEAKSASEAKSNFLATMSHEIRTPMNGVLGMAMLLSETELNTEQREYSQTILHSGEALLNVINDILDFSKIESGKMELDLHDFDLRTCVEEVLDLFATQAAHAELDLMYQVDNNLPTHLVGDGMRLRQVLINLLGNALKFTHRGEIFLGVHLVKHLNSDEIEVGFEVRDTGIGIPQAKVGKLFQAFSQVDSSTTRKYGGTGLGLAICERLVELMGGTITVTSQPDIGTSFTFNIICAIGQQQKQSVELLAMTGIEGRRILVVDDNLTNRKILQLQLEHWKLKPVMVESAQDALQLLRTDKEFDLVITDMQMPGMDGVELSRLIKEKNKKLPIILLSSIGNETKKNPELFIAVLTKPPKQQHLGRVIATGLQHYPQQIENEVKPENLLNQEFAESYPLKIMVAEDNPINQKMILRVLDKLGYSPALATNGKEAIAMLDEQYYDIILMDVQMPEMDGLEATRYIRKNYKLQPTIVAMTANAMVGDREECLKAGMDNYISKPVKIETLISVLKEVKQNLLH